MISTSKELVEVLVFPRVEQDRNVIKQVTFNINTFDTDYQDIVVKNPAVAKYDIQVQENIITVASENLPQLTDEYNLNTPDYVDLKTNLASNPYVQTGMQTFDMVENKVTSIPFTIGGSSTGQITIRFESQETFPLNYYFASWLSRTPGGEPELLDDNNWNSYRYSNNIVGGLDIAGYHNQDDAAAFASLNYGYMGEDYGVRYLNICIIDWDIAATEPGFVNQKLHQVPNWTDYIGRKPEDITNGDYTIINFRFEADSANPDNVTYPTYTTDETGYLIADNMSNNDIIAWAYETIGGDDYYDTNIKSFAESQLEALIPLSGTVSYNFRT